MKLLLTMSFIVISMIALSQERNYDQTSVIVRLNFKLLDWNVIDDDEIKTTYIGNYLNEQGKSELDRLPELDFNFAKLPATKIFSYLHTKDSISIGRQGNTVYVPPFWATFRVDVPEGIEYVDFLENMNNLYPLVIYGHPKYYLEYHCTPNDTLFHEQASLSDSIGINVDSAWCINTGENWVKVGVFDTGIDSSHADLELLTGWMSYDDLSHSWGTDTDGHGTQVAGIIGAKRNNTTGVAGIAGGDGSDTMGVNLIDFRNGPGGIDDIELWCASIINSSRSPGSYYHWDPFVGTLKPVYYDNAPGYGVHVNNFSSGFTIQSLAKTEDPPTTPGGPASFVDCNLCIEAYLFSLQNGVVSTCSRGNPPLANGNPATYEGPRIYPAGFHDSWVMSVGSSGNDGERLIQGQNTSSQYFSPNGYDIDVIAPGSFDIVYTTESSASNLEYGHFDGNKCRCSSCRWCCCIVNQSLQ